ncbi:hypothetical protein Mithridates_00136 [Acinetobacter phage Mithridates]|nr:hypothetical protein Mithridates_00136 [Acinetobacter phage Mithridates]
MDKFRVGDYVKIIASTSQLGSICAPKRLKGKCGTVLGENRDGFYRVTFSGNINDYWCVRRDHIDKVVG